MSGKMLTLVLLSGMFGAGRVLAVEANEAKPAEAAKAMAAAPAATPAPAEATAPKAPLASPTDTNAVIVTVNGKSLTMGMVNWMQPNAEPAVIKQIADFWVTTQLLNAEAVKRKIASSPKAQFLSELSTMQAYGREVIQQVQEAATVTEAEVNDYYSKNKDTDPGMREQVKSTLERKVKSTVVQEFINSLKEKAAPEIKKSEFLLQAEKLAPVMGPSGMGGPGSVGGAPRQMRPPAARPVPPPVSAQPAPAK